MVSGGPIIALMKGTSPWTIIGVSLLSVVGLLLIAVGGLRFTSIPRHVTIGNVVQGSSTPDATGGNPWLHGTYDIQYSVPGSSRTLTIHVQNSPIVCGSSCIAGVGSQVNISYNPQNPTDAHVTSQNPTATRDQATLAIIAGVTCLFLTGFWSIRSKKRRLRQPSGYGGVTQV